MNCAATAAVNALPIDNLIWYLEEAVAAIAEIETRRSGLGIKLSSLQPIYPQAATMEQHQRMRDCRAEVESALMHAREYAKGPHTK